MKRFFTVAGFIIILLAAVFLSQASNQPGQVKVDFLNVGQGDAVLIQVPSGQRILIDGGPDQSVLSELASVMPFWANEIDLVIVSHFHEDHTGGLPSIASHYKIKELVFDNYKGTLSKKNELLDILKNEGVNLATVPGKRQISLAPNCELTLVGADQLEADENYSLVTKLNCLGRSWLFLGDATAAEQQKMRIELPEWRADTVKISHHGSDDGLDEAWLKQLEAKVAVIEVGQNNKYKHPSRRVIKKLERLGLSIRRTDLDGRVSFVYNQ